MPRGWKMGAMVLVWPAGDHPPLLGRIVSEAAYEDTVAAGVQTEHGFCWALAATVSSAGPIVDAIAGGKCVSYGHC